MMMTDDTRMDLHLLFFGSQPVRVALECGPQLSKKLLLKTQIEAPKPLPCTPCKMTCCPNWLFKWRSSARSLPGLPYEDEREEDSGGEPIDSSSSPWLPGMLMGLVGES